MDSFELDLGIDGVREAIRLIDGYTEGANDRLSGLQEARRALVDAYNALEAVSCPDDEPEAAENESEEGS